MTEVVAGTAQEKAMENKELGVTAAAKARVGLGLAVEVQKEEDLVVMAVQLVAMAQRVGAAAEGAQSSSARRCERRQTHSSTVAGQGRDSSRARSEGMSYSGGRSRRQGPASGPTLVIHHSRCHPH